jgi:DNA polymerase-3 subunit delta
VTAIKPSDVDAFVARPDPRRPVVLVYGPDLGLVRERAETLLKAARPDDADPFSTVTIDGDTLAADPARLADEAGTLALFGGRRLVHVRGGSRNFVEAVEILLADPPRDALVVIEAGNLARTAPLRKLAEASRHAAALPCYADDERSIARLVDSTIRDAGLTIDSDARETLIALLGADRLATRSELDKLVLHAGKSRRVTFDDVLSVTADSAALALDDVVDAAAAGDAEAATVSFARARASGIPVSVVIGAAIRHVAALHRLSLRVEQGEHPARVVAEPQARIFFRRQSSFERALNRLGPRELEQSLVALGAALLNSRKAAALDDSIAERELLTLAQGARKRSNR